MHYILCIFFGRLEVPSFKLLGIILVISFGVMLTGIYIAHLSLYFFELVNFVSTSVVTLSWVT